MGLGKWQQAIELVLMMRSEGVQPNVITYNTAIHSCAKTRQTEKGVMFFQELLLLFGTSEMTRRWEQVNALVKAGHLRSAIAMYYDMHHGGLLRRQQGDQGSTASQKGQHMVSCG